MKLIIFTHPEFLDSQSMPKFAMQIRDGMSARGHEVEFWTAKPRAYRLPAPQRFKKWLGYVDQFLIFPLQIRYQLKSQPRDTVYIFADQALGPWVPLVGHLPHAIHVHDFLALRSAMGEFKQNPISWTGRAYQNLIRRGFTRGNRFISVSAKTQLDLHNLLPSMPVASIVVHNGLNFPFEPMSSSEVKNILLAESVALPADGFLLHIGGNQWYKNRSGVLSIYAAYLERTANPLPLVMIGAKPTEQILNQVAGLQAKGDVRFIIGASTEVICAAYSSASAFVFPSIAEGFGWPIIEAMACGCPVLTTDDAPMTEVGGTAARYLPRMDDGLAVEQWAAASAGLLLDLLTSSAEVKSSIRAAGLMHAQNFQADKALDAYELAYMHASEAK